MTFPAALLDVRGLKLGYGGKPVVADVNLKVRPGEFWFLLGPNGSGKSTLLQALLGLMAPQAGEIGRALGLAEIGFVPQRCDLNPTLPTTIREFVSLGAVGLARAHRQEDIHWALEKVRLPDISKRSYWAISGGQRQRALLARALVRRPRLLILDEPTNGLDPTSQEALMESLKALNREDGLTMLFVTHDLGLAVHYGSHVALFAGGGVRAGEAAAVLTPANLEQVYGIPIRLDPSKSGGAGHAD